MNNHFNKKEIIDKIVVSLLFGVLGFALNFNNFHLYLNILVILGSIPGLIVTLIYGPIFGILTSLISFTSIYLTQQDSYLLILFPLEAAFIGLLTRKGIPSIITMIIFWLFIGDVFVYTIAKKNLGLSNATALILITKHIQNSIFNLLIAEMLLISSRIKKFFFGESYKTKSANIHSIIILFLTFMTVIPILFINIFNTQILINNELTRTKANLFNEASSLKINLADYLKKHTEGVTILARTVELSDESDTEHLTKLTTNAYLIYPGFILVYIGDTKGNILAAYPPTSSTGTKLIGVNLSHRDYFKNLMATQSTTFSQTFTSGIDIEEPTIAIVEPIFTEQKELMGYAFGALDLKELNKFILQLKLSADENIILTDKNKKVITSSAPDKFKTLADMANTSLMDATQFKNSGTLEYYDVVDNKSVISDENKRLAGFTSIDLVGWKIFVDKSIEGLLTQVQDIYLKTATVLIITIIAATILSYLISLRLSKPINSLAELAHSMPEKLSNGSRLSTYPSYPREINILITTFKEMTQKLTESYSQLQKAAEESNKANVALGKLSKELEAKVKERTIELEEKNNELIRLQKIRSDFISMLTHDLKTPLTSVFGYTSILLNDSESRNNDEILNNSLKNIFKNTNKLLDMINDFLIFSKLESGTMPIIRERFQITDTFTTALQTVSFHIENKHIELIKEFQDKLPDIYGSPSLISRVFQNLLSNAVKFNKDNGRVIIKIKREDNFVVTSIEDTGKGISEKSLPHIFDLYFRDSVESKTEGSGLGLAVVKSILQAHNGNISVKSHIGVGSIFTFKLPISNQ